MRAASAARRGGRAARRLQQLRSLFNKDDGIAPDEPADKLYNEGVFLLDRRKDYKDAAKKFEEVERQHPYSDWARKSLIMMAYAHYTGPGL